MIGVGDLYTNKNKKEFVFSFVSSFDMCFGIDLFVIFFRGYEDVPVVIANPPAIPRPIAWFWGIAANILQAIIVVCLWMNENWKFDNEQYALSVRCHVVRLFSYQDSQLKE